jgi:MarR family transcriptional regulator, organic hydroperoxide resistance regulator
MADWDQKLAHMDTILSKLQSYSRQSPVANHTFTKQQLFLLRTLLQSGRTMMSSLAELLGLSASATTIALNRLVKDGLINRVRDETDRRVVWVELSEQGLATAKELQGHRNRIFQDMMEALTEEEAEQFVTLLTKITNRLTKS